MTTGGKFKRYATGLLALGAAASMTVACSSGGSKATDTGPVGGSTSTTTAAVQGQLALADDAVAATLDPRFQSYNIEMVEVTGGQFWQPYDAGTGKVTRPPIDLSSTKLRNLAKALGPVYIRVSGSWANSTYFDVDGTTGGKAPEGFGGVLTTDQWDGVGAFAKAVDGEIVTSFPSSEGARDASGAWQPRYATDLLEYSRDHGIPVVAAEMFNEPNFPMGLPGGYTAADYTRDFNTFVAAAHEAMPDLKIVGPSTTGEVLKLVLDPPLKSPDLLKGTADRTNIFSYHFYPKVSARCGSTEDVGIALSSDYLNRVEASKKYYEGLRDKFMPKAPVWVTETAQAACGGDKWAAQYADVIRYVDNLGRLGTGDGDVVFHNTLAASDYGLLDEKDLRPRPDYWAAVLWARLMGPKVLTPNTSGLPADVTVYAHCSASKADGGVTYAVLNTSTNEARTIGLGKGDAKVYQLTGPALTSDATLLNGKTLGVNDDGTLPKMDAKSASGSLELPPASVSFVVTQDGANACK